MFDLNLIRTFVAVAETAGVSQAAEKLGVPKSTVSRHVARLEEATGSALFVRRSDGLELTGAGRRLFARTRDAISALSATLDADERSGTERPIVVHSPIILARGLLKSILAEYAAENPLTSIDVRLSGRYEVPPADNVDLVFLVGATANRDFEQWPIGQLEAHLYGAPHLFEEESMPTRPADLEKWPIILPTCIPGSPNRLKLFSKKEETTVMLQSPRLTTDEADLLIESACQGLGIMRMATFLAEPRVRSGELVRVLPEWHVERLSLSIGRSLRTDHPGAAALADFAATQLSRQTVR